MNDRLQRADGGALQPALREWRRQMRAPRLWAVLLVVAGGLTILAPFGLGAILAPAGRFAYLLALATGTYAIGLFVHLWLHRLLPRDLAGPLRVLATGGATAAAILPVVALANAATFWELPSARGWAVIAARALGISLVVSALFRLLGADGTVPADPGRPALLDRLPRPKRGRLLALSAQDHYTEVVTERGRSLVLIRLSDAIREAAPTRGLQVHRSHWVALDAATAARRSGDRAVLTLPDGAEIPVSRANLAAAKAAGLIR